MRATGWQTWGELSGVKGAKIGVSKPDKLQDFAEFACVEALHSGTLILIERTLQPDQRRASKKQKSKEQHLVANLE